MPLAIAVVLADEWAKRWALGELPAETAILNPGPIAFGIHKNWGIAFDIPFRMPVIVVTSVLIGAALLWVTARNLKTRPGVAIAALTIVIGALGNLYDRLAYGFTVDYIILFSRSAINISDLVIVIGVIALLVSSRTKAPIDKRDGTE